MATLGEFLIAFFTLYLSLTGAAADYISRLSSTYNDSDKVLSKVTSNYESIPDILVKNAAYQSGTAITTESERVTTSDPLAALVNVFCSYQTGDYTRTTTGTGFFIHSDGVILTNAHVAQFLLLETVSGEASCIVRTGSPAIPSYAVDLLYISPAWIQKHAKLIDVENPRGTGERDYALLYVTAGLDNKPMPRHFPALTVNSELLSARAIGLPVVAAGYPAETAFTNAVYYDQLIARAATTTVGELMTFGSNYADLMTITGSTVGEQGSSGGPVVTTAGEAIGIISTKGDDARYGNGSLRALTLSYVNRTMQEETGFTLNHYIKGNLPYRSKLFKETLGPFLQRMLERELEN